MVVVERLSSCTGCKEPAGRGSLYCQVPSSLQLHHARSIIVKSFPLTLSLPATEAALVQKLISSEAVVQLPKGADTPAILPIQGRASMQCYINTNHAALFLTLPRQAVRSSERI